jgi:hypothetical protein
VALSLELMDEIDDLQKHITLLSSQLPWSWNESSAWDVIVRSDDFSMYCLLISPMYLEYLDKKLPYK